MLALNIPELKNFMNQLLCSDTFDHFLLKEATIQKDAVWNFYGTVTPDFYSSEELEEQGLSGLAFLPYGRVRQHCFDLIKGKRTPSYFKFVFLLSPDNLSRTLASMQTPFTPQDVTGMFLNLKFQNGNLMLTTGVSYRIFSTDKSLEHEWDRLVEIFLKNHNIVIEKLG